MLYLVSSKKSRYTAIIDATSHTDARQYNQNTAGLGGVLTKLSDLPTNPPAYFLGIHVTPNRQAQIIQNNHARGIS